MTFVERWLKPQILSKLLGLQREIGLGEVLLIFACISDTVESKKCIGHTFQIFILLVVKSQCHSGLFALCGFL